MFRSPKRRQTRQRSGFSVSGNKSGNEAILSRARSFNVESPGLDFEIQRSGCPLPEQFKRKSGLAGVGGYIKTTKDATVELELIVHDALSHELLARQTNKVQAAKNKWIRFGIHAEVDDAGLYEAVDLKATIKLTPHNKGPLKTTQLFGVNIDTVVAFSDRDVRHLFDTKTNLYIPEVYYLKQDSDFLVEPVAIYGKVSSISAGEQVVLKACNRCERYLLIDVLDERQVLGFSNHCLQRAPCQHGAFSRFVIENAALTEVDLRLRKSIVESSGNQVVKVHYGYQLECRSCKKFTVNAPLNPLRSATQHREDSLRRRAFEQLVMHLLERDWIFFTYREKMGEEFDTHIWEKFGRCCFNCGKSLATSHDMDLDHTLPLNYLWPLDETATCLCSTCNSQKHDRFPFEFYQDKKKLELLAELTGLSKDLVVGPQKPINTEAVTRLKREIVWFFDEFLAHSDYQKVRDGKKAADLIVASLQRVFIESQVGWKLEDEYKRKTGKYPSSVTINEGN